jgi:hypothetical protein
MQVGLLYAIWNRRTKNTQRNEVYLFFSQMVFLSIPMGLFLEWIKNLLYAMIPTSGFVGNFIICMVIGLLFLSIFISCGYLFGIREISELIHRFFSRLRKKT